MLQARAMNGYDCARLSVCVCVYVCVCVCVFLWCSMCHDEGTPKSRSLIPRDYLEYHTVSKLRQLHIAQQCHGHMHAVHGTHVSLSFVVQFVLWCICVRVTQHRYCAHSSVEAEVRHMTEVAVPAETHCNTSGICGNGLHGLGKAVYKILRKGLHSTSQT